MHGVGIDQLEIDRMERALARTPNLRDRLFTEAEQRYAAERRRPAQYLAARFCAKEAVAKSLELHGWSPREIEVVPTQGAPTVQLHGRVAERAEELGVTEFKLSITHSRVMAAAVAIAS